MSALKKQKGLGRGLDALMGDAPPARKGRAKKDEADQEVGAGPRPKSSLPIEFLKANPDQPRRHFNEDALSELADSIKAKGLLQPILVRPIGGSAYEIVAGERRWRAAQKARLHDVPVIVRELTDEEAAEIAVIENVQRVDLNPVEEARAYQRLNETYGRSHDRIAKAVGKSRSHVANTMRLLALPEDALDALSEGKITAGHARAILAAPKPMVLYYAVVKENLSVREAERLTQEAQRIAKEQRGGIAPKKDAGPKQASGGKKDADTRALEADLSAALGLEVEIDHAPKGAGAVTIRYLTLDQLDDVCRRLMGAGV